MATLSLRGLSKRFGPTEVLHDITIDIADREFVVFIGPSGCGKTTLLRIIAGLDDATAGDLEVDGKDVAGAHPLERGISMVFQSYALYPHLDVFENIAFPLRVARAPEAEVKRRVGEAADILQLGDRLTFKPKQLSGGQRQRVAIGRAIVRKPRIFLFDEPLSNLDAALRGEMRVELARLHQRLDTTMIYVTHDQTEAMTMADRIVVLSDGVLQQYGTPLELFHHPANAFVAGFIGQPNMNFLAGTCTGADSGSISVSIPGIGDMELPMAPAPGLEAGQPVRLGLRPDDIRLGESKHSLAMRVEVLERLGNDAVAYGSVERGGKFCAMVDGAARIWEGEEAMLGVEPAACHLFTAEGIACRRLQAPELAAKAKPMAAAAGAGA